MVRQGSHRLDVRDLDLLIRHLAAQGYAVTGPRRVAAGGPPSTLGSEPPPETPSTLGWGPIDGAEALPAGWTARAEPGRFRLERRADRRRFGFVVTASAPKASLLPPTRPLSRVTRAGGRLRILPAEAPTRPEALIGARSCDLAALDRLRRILPQGSRPERPFVVAVACSEPAETCFCASLGTGPAPSRGFDVALTELADDVGEPWYVAAAGSPDGQALLEAVGRPASEADRAAADQELDRAERRFERRFDPSDLPRLLLERPEHRAWGEVADRCLACGNCTAVCPTCFCFDVEDRVDLDGASAERRQVWGSCFDLRFTHLHGGSVRRSVRARYRQWLTHKLATWTEQTGELGCVGCGRCITWCPVGIDLGQVVQSLRSAEPEAGRRRKLPEGG